MQPAIVKLRVLAVLLSFFFPLAASTYTLIEDYPVASFFDKFDFFSAPDPTNGFVQYVEQASASLAGLISTSNGSVIIRPEAAIALDPCPPAPGRKSVRLESKNSYQYGVRTISLIFRLNTCESSV